MSQKSDPRRPALIAFVVLLVALLAVIVTTTPWETLPEPPGGRVPVDATRDYAPADIALEDRYHRWLWPAVLGGTFVTLLVTVVLGLTAIGTRIARAVARPFGGGAVATLVLGTLAAVAIPFVAALPLSIWRENIQRDYGLIVRGWGDYALDTAKSYGLLAAMTLIGLSVLYVLMRRFPRRWWAPGAAGGAVLVVASSFVYPLVVEPAFHDFSSLPAGDLRSSVLAMAAQDGVEVDDVLVADESKRSTRLNAYVSGIGSSRRVVLYDTTVDKLPPAEIRQIVAHEFGHVKDNDVLDGTLVGALGAATGVCALYLAVSSPWLRRRAGVDDPADPASLALVLAVVAVVVAVSTPVGLAVSRKVEARADVHALNLTRDPATLIAMQRRLSAANLGDVDPPWIVTFLRSTHPTGPTRIANARTWARLHGVPEPPDQADVPIPRR
ncbi:M48 family metallopeptidase [Sporichthya polymorpha]|uniref:M48 family metallopeptidase n=1 Tax=Sporichthya polymorpha TaxID=35751 RepID=UPI00036A18BF|nr:M48 family metallopeptidase [Sporichthya polymorpha]